MTNISGNGIPSKRTAGNIGSVYTNLLTNKQYECVRIYSTITKGKQEIEYIWKEIEANRETAGTVVSPVVNVVEIEDGHRVVISDVNGVKSFDVMNGEDGEDYSGEALTGVVSNDSIACKIIAHRGYHVNSYQNTIAAFKEAINDGFKYLEIDIRKTADGMYVLSHDDTITLYNAGVSTSVTISKSNYSVIKNYTWDAAGEHVLNTLQALFNAMKVYDVIMICDRKSGSNAEIVELANLCGVTDRIILSYTSIGSAISNVDLLNKYDNITLRVVPSDYAKLTTLAETISNPIYADVNASMTIHRGRYLNYAFTAGMPILFSGCSLSNKDVWAQVAGGCMSNDNDNISYDTFKETLTGNYDLISDLTVSETTIETEVTDVVTLTASNSIENISGNIYAYSKNPLIAEVEQTTFGNSVSVTVTSKMVGETTIVMFDGVGGNVQIPMTVINSTVSEPTMGVQTNLDLVKGCSISGNDAKVYTNGARMIATATSGLYPLCEGNNVWDGSRFPIAVPEEATKVIITCEGYTPGLMLMNYDTLSSYYVKVKDGGWQTANSTTYDLTAYPCEYIAINFKNSSNSTITSDVDTSGITIEFV